MKLDDGAPKMEYSEEHKVSHRWGSSVCEGGDDVNLGCSITGGTYGF